MKLDGLNRLAALSLKFEGGYLDRYWNECCERGHRDRVKMGAEMYIVQFGALRDSGLEFFEPSIEIGTVIRIELRKVAIDVCAPKFLATHVRDLRVKKIASFVGLQN